MDILFNTISLTRYIMASGIVFGLMGALYCAVLLYKRKHMHGTFQPQKRRLKVMESLPLSARHKMVIIRQDDMEHTVIIGGPTDLHICTTEAKTTHAISQNTSETDDEETYTIGFLKKLPTKNQKSATKEQPQEQKTSQETDA